MKENKRHGMRFVLCCFLVSVLLSAAVIVVCCDAFGFMKAQREQTVVIPEGATAKDVADTLRENGIISFPAVYTLYAKLRRFGGDYLSGEFTLDNAMSYDELRYALSPRRGIREQIRVTIPEGYTTAQIIDYFTKRGIGTEDGFYEVIENGGDLGFDFVRAIPEKEGRATRLDGYLFPDTYFVYADASETEIIKKLLSGFDKRFDGKMREDAAIRGYTLDEIVTLASLVEAESYYKADMPLVSSVFHNRLKSRSYPFLESDAAVKYGKAIAGGVGAPTAEDIRTLDSPYNTYRNRGLPPGAICSPGQEALRAAVYPEKTNYNYFVSSKGGKTVFSHTYEEHMRAVASIRRAAERNDNG